MVIWSDPGGASSHTRVFQQQDSAEQAANARRAEGSVVTVVDTRWGKSPVISSDPGAKGLPDGDTELEAGRAG